MSLVLCPRSIVSPEFVSPEFAVPEFEFVSPEFACPRNLLEFAARVTVIRNSQLKRRPCAPAFDRPDQRLARQWKYLRQVHPSAGHLG